MDIADRPRQSVPGNGLAADVCGKVFGHGWPNLGNDLRLSFLGHVMQEANHIFEGTRGNMILNANGLVPKTGLSRTKGETNTMVLESKALFRG